MNPVPVTVVAVVGQAAPGVAGVLAQVAAEQVPLLGVRVMSAPEKSPPPVQAHATAIVAKPIAQKLVAPTDSRRMLIVQSLLSVGIPPGPGESREILEKSRHFGR